MTEICRFLESYLRHPIVTLILQRENHKHQNRTGDKLGEELTGRRHKRLRVRAEYPSCCCLTRRYRPNPVALELVDRIEVVRIDDSRADKTAQNLRDEIDRKASPGELAVYAHR